MGGYNKVKSFFKYFIIPGRDHSGAGNGVNDLELEEKNMISALRYWCEKGKEPEFITARRTEVKDGEKVIIFERKIYPYKADKKETEQFPRSCDIDYLKH